MVGLSVVLEAQKGSGCTTDADAQTAPPQVINKATVMINNMNNKPTGSNSSSSSFSLHPPTSSPSCFRNYSGQSPTTFLDHCVLCKKRILPGNDIYMYKGDSPFCSEECRCKQIFMDDEEGIQKSNCSFSAGSASNSSASSSSSSSGRRKASRNRAGGFAY